jgi:hypothetical protein
MGEHIRFIGGFEELQAAAANLLEMTYELERRLVRHATEQHPGNQIRSRDGGV